MAANPSAIPAECETNTIPGEVAVIMAAILQCRTGFDNYDREGALAIQSIERAAAILRALAGGPRRLGVSELSERLGLAKGTVHGLLRALQDEGFVEQDPESGKYQLGGSLLQLGNIYLDVNELRGRSLAWSDNLAIRTGEAVRVGTLHGDGVLVIHHVFRPDNTLQILEVGAHLPLHATALGKALLAHHHELEHEVMDAGLVKLTRATITAPSGLARALEGVRTNGWASEQEEAVIGEASVAAPIFDRRGIAAGAVGVVGPVDRIAKGRSPRPELVSHVRDAARAISRDLGGGR
jgi:DNA-binding IclR family transcriptional regulator